MSTSVPSISGTLVVCNPAAPAVPPAVVLAVGGCVIVDAAACPSWINGGCELQSARTNGFYLAGAWVRGLSCMCQGYRPRWYHLRTFVGIGCRVYLAGRLHVIHCGITAGPLMHDNRVWVRELIRTHHRVMPRRCMGARPNPHVPTGYTSLVSL